MDEWGKKIPILRLAGRAHWRSAILPGFLAGGGIESLSAPPLASSSLGFRGPPRLGPLDSPALYSAFLSNSEEDPPPFTPTTTYTDARQSVRASDQSRDGRARAPSLGVAGDAGALRGSPAGVLESYYTNVTAELNPCRSI